MHQLRPLRPFHTTHQSRSITHHKAGRSEKTPTRKFCWSAQSPACVLRLGTVFDIFIPVYFNDNRRVIGCPSVTEFSGVIFVAESSQRTLRSDREFERNYFRICSFSQLTLRPLFVLLHITALFVLLWIQTVLVNQTSNIKH
jgi:hypothetical protein